MAYGNSDIALMLADFGESVSVGTVTAIGYLDRDGQSWGDDAPIGVEVQSLTYRASDFPSMAPNTIATIAGVGYVVSHGPRLISDGLLAVVLLETRV